MLLALSRLLAALSLLSSFTTAQPESTSVELSFFPNFPVEEGLTDGTCTFHTTVVGQTVGSVSWTHNVSQEVTGDSRVTVETDISGGRSDLKINSVTQSDAGDYTCTVNFVGPSQQKAATAQLSVATELVVETEPEQTAVEGEPAFLLCNATSFPAPRIKWLRVAEDETETELVTQSRTDSDFGAYKVSDAVSGSDAGTYRCTGQYSFGVESRDIELVVLTVPVITTEVMEVTFLYTKSLHLTCSATGIRKPTYQWLFGGQELVHGGRVELDSENGNLSIGDLTYDDAGQYTCVAETGAGTDSITHTVAVEGKPEILLPEGQELEQVVADNSVVEIKCPFRSLPLPTVTWVKIQPDGKREEINSLAGGFTIFPGNASLLIWNVSQSQASYYDCILSNKHGSDNRTFFLIVVDAPLPPEEFSVVEKGPDYVRLTWSPAPSSPIQPVEEYVLELSYEERGTVISTEVIPRNLTLYMVDGLVPGVTYRLTLRSSNLAGLSSPTQSLSHATASDVPRLDFFEVESLGDGRSILLQWRLLYSGGHPVNVFEIQVKAEGKPVETLRPDVYQESLLLDDLRPTTDYSFELTVGNFLGTAPLITRNASTPIAAPSRPTRPELEERGPQSLSLSFSVKHGSYPIHYYLVLISELSDLTINQTTFDFTNTTERIANISSEDKNSVVGQEEWENEGEVVGYHASLKVRGLRPRQSYVFSVAAASVVGVGDFSEPSQPFTLEDGELLLYLIVGGVLAGVLLVAVLLVVLYCVGLYIRRQHQGGKITITRRGSDSTGVATDYNLKFESFNGGAPPNQGTSSPNPSQRVDSTTPPFHITSPRVTSPLLNTQHYYNSLRKYQLDTLPVGTQTGDTRGGRVVEVQIHSNIHSSGVPGTKNNSADMIDSGHYSRPTSHPPSLPPSSSSHPPPFLPPPLLPTSSTLPSLPSPTKPQHPSYNYPTSLALYSIPRNASHALQVSMSALPTADEGRSQVVGVVNSGSNTLPCGATIDGDDYTIMQRVPRGGHSSHGEARRIRSLEPNIGPDGSKFESDGSLHSKHPSYQTDV